MTLNVICEVVSRALKKHKAVKYLLSSIAAAAVLMLSAVSAAASSQNDFALLSGSNRWYMTTYQNQDNTSYVPKGSVGGNLIIWDLPVSIAATYGDETTEGDRYRYCNGWLYFNLTFNFSYSYPLNGTESYSLSPSWTADGVTTYCESISSTADSATFGIFISVDDFQRVRVSNALTFNLHVSGTHATATQSALTYTVTRNSYINKLIWSSVPAHEIDTSSIVAAINDVNATASDIDRVIGLLNSKLQNVVTNQNDIKNDLSAIKDAIAPDSPATNPADQAASGASSAAADLDRAESMLTGSATLAPADLDSLNNSSVNVISNIAQSMSFWGLVISSFTSSGGIFWTVLLLGLSVGLFAFILRIR